MWLPKDREDGKVSLSRKVQEVQTGNFETCKLRETLLTRVGHVHIPGINPQEFSAFDKDATQILGMLSENSECMIHPCKSNHKRC